MIPCKVPSGGPGRPCGAEGRGHARASVALVPRPRRILLVPACMGGALALPGCRPLRTLRPPGRVWVPMTILGRLLLLLVGVPLLELFILLRVGQAVGVWPTVGLVVVTGLVGMALARMEGLRTLWSLRAALARGYPPGPALLDGFAILAGGALLFTPGLITDLLGFSCLLPWTRRRLLRWARRGVERRLKTGAIHVTHFTGYPGESRIGFEGQARGQWEGSGEWGQGRLDPRDEIVIEPRDPEET